MGGKGRYSAKGSDGYYVVDHQGGRGRGNGKGKGANGNKWQCAGCCYSHPSSTLSCPWCSTSPYSIPSQSYAASRNNAGPIHNHKDHSDWEPNHHNHKHSDWRSNRKTRWGNYQHHLQQPNQRVQPSRQPQQQPQQPKGHGEDECDDFDISTPPTNNPSDQVVNQVLAWLKEKGESSVAETIQRVQAHDKADQPAPAPKDPVRDLQSTRDKLKSVQYQLDTINNHINNIQADLEAALDTRNALSEKQDDLQKHIESIMPGASNNNDSIHKAASYEHIIRAIQSKLATGVPEAGSDDSKELFDIVYHGIVKEVAAPAPSATVPPADKSTSQNENGTSPEAKDDSSFVVDENGFGFNPVPRKASHLSAPYMRRPRAASADAARGAALFASKPCAMAKAEEAGKA